MSNDEGRLERCATYKFLGDALLDYCVFPPPYHQLSRADDLVVVEALYHQYPEADPASLTYMCVSVPHRLLENADGPRTPVAETYVSFTCS